MKTKENKPTTPTTPTTCADLVHTYNDHPNDPTALVNLATAVTYSVLRKVIDPTRKNTPTNDRPADNGQNPALTALRTSLTRDRAYLDRLAYAVNNSTRFTFNEDGDPVIEVADRDLYKATAALAGETLGDGLDLVHDAVVSILEETAKQSERDGNKPTDLERPYSVRRLNRKVWIKTAESVNGWEEAETTPIQEIFKAVRRSIQNSRAIQTDPRNGYSYLEDLAIDPATGDGSTIYRRLPKYADVGGDGTHDRPAAYIPGQPADLDGKPTKYSADRATVDDLDRIISRLGLTDREMTVLKYRLAGYGYKAIATAMGLTVDNVKRCVRRLREKATAVGMSPTAALAD